MNTKTTLAWTALVGGAVVLGAVFFPSAGVGPWPDADAAAGGAPELVVRDARPLVDAAPPFPLVETFLVRSPSNPAVLLASAMSTSAERSVLYRSEDRGDTWVMVKGSEGFGFPGGDPMLAFGDDGSAYFSTITPVIHVWRSRDGGRRWTGPAVVGEGLASDRQWVAMSRPRDGGEPLVLTTAKTPGSDGGGRDVVLVSSSGDGGLSFRPPDLMPLDSGYLNTTTDLLVLADGTILLPFLANYGRLPGGREIYRGRRWILRSADDRGRRWSDPYPVAENLQFGNRSWDRAMKGLGGGDLAVDESGGPHHGTVYMTWSAVIDGYLQIVVAHSPDGGRTWAPPVRVNDGGSASDHSTPTLAVNHEGVILVTWNDRRDDPEGLCFRHFAAASTDGGRTFGPNRAVSESDTCPGARSRWLNGGDTQGLVAMPDGRFRTVWTGESAGALAPWTALIEVR